MVDEKYRAEESRDEHPANMMEEECEVHGILLAVVVSDQVNRLEMRRKRVCHGDHMPDQLAAMLFETFYDLKFFARVRHEVFLNHAAFFQRLHVELLQEDVSDQSVFLGRSEALIL